MPVDLTEQHIRALAPHARQHIVDGLIDYRHLLELYDVDTPLRVAHFLAQCCHESDHFRVTREYASGSAYEGRRDLGNIRPGDGRRFAGRGLIQLTGRANYTDAADALKLPLATQPELAEKFPAALAVSLWFWQRKGVNKPADADDVVAVTKIVNGGARGLAERARLTAVAKGVFGYERQPDPTFFPVLREGDEGDAVARMQRLLGIKDDGKFGPRTAEALRLFQREAHLVDDAVCGPRSWAVLLA